jgi:peptide chain release factor 1
MLQLVDRNIEDVKLTKKLSRQMTQLPIPDYLTSTISDLDDKISQAKHLLGDPELQETAKAEIVRLEKERSDILISTNYQLPTTNSPTDPYDNRNIILEIRGAAGGEEAKIWGDDLLRMYTRYAQTQGWKVFPEGEASIKITGRGVYGQLKYEAGVHRVQRVPSTESSGRVHTSTATVAVLPELEDFDIHIDPSDIEEQFYRAGSKGGQNVNKVSSAVRLIHKPSGLVVTCQEERDQSKNRDKALSRLRQLLWEAEENRRIGELTAERRAQIGTGMRNEKIRTYNFLQDRVTDHRLDQNFHNIQKITGGNISEIIEALQSKFCVIPA